MTPIDIAQVTDEASALWSDGVPWIDALCLAAGSACVVWIDPDGCELLEVERSSDAAQ